MHSQRSYLLGILANFHFPNQWGCWGGCHWNPTRSFTAFPSPGGCFSVVWCCVRTPWGAYGSASLLCKTRGSRAGNKQEIKKDSVPGWPSVVREKTLASADSLEICQSFLLLAQRGLGIIAPWPGVLLSSTRSHPGHNKSSLLARAAKAIEKGEGSS